MTLNYTICKSYPEDSTMWGFSCTIDLSEKKKVSHGPLLASGGNVDGSGYIAASFSKVVWPFGIFTNRSTFENSHIDNPVLSL